ncbi:unnamed protein product [Lymnaea stagnalis]|uniref:RecQ-mediated genome instability protein 2 n=1 Tax=Lymnaea stagnalis TaxID=6523 RepID=A0AAV2H739_LYMST
MSLLKLPSNKILAVHLQHCVDVRNATSGEVNMSSASNITWECQLRKKSFPVSPSVWIQGIVVNFQNPGSTALIDDGTGIIVLPNCDSIASKIAIKKGMYVMAVGALQSGGPHPVIKPIKLQDLSDDVQAETMWPLEVFDQIKYLNG